MPSRRMQRINQLIREELAELLQREIKDEALASSLISITEVDTSPDLRTARVYFSVYGDEEAVSYARSHLEKAANFLRRGLMDRLDLRQVPRLEFQLDESLARGDRLMQLMRVTEAQHAGPPEGDPDQSRGSA